MWVTFLLSFLVISQVSGQCKWPNGEPNNDFFARVKGKTFNTTQDDSTFTLSMCGKLTDPKMGVQQMVGGESHSAGSLNNAHLLVMNGGEFMLLTLSLGDTYGTDCNEKTRSSQIAMHCDRAAKGDGELSVLFESGVTKVSLDGYMLTSGSSSCNFNLELRSSLLCRELKPKVPETTPTTTTTTTTTTAAPVIVTTHDDITTSLPSPAPDTGLRFGSILDIIFFTCLAVYLGGGYAYQTFVVGSIGIERVPHVYFWQDLFALVADGASFMCRCGQHAERQFYSSPPDSGGLLSHGPVDLDDEILSP